MVPAADVAAAVVDVSTVEEAAATVVCWASAVVVVVASVDVEVEVVEVEVEVEVEVVVRNLRVQTFPLTVVVEPSRDAMQKTNS